MDTLGVRVKHMRKILKLTQVELSKITGMSQGNISEIEADNKTFSYEAVISLMRYFKDSAFSVNWLLTGEGEMRKTATPPQPPADADIDDRERLLVDNFRELNDEQKRFLINQSARLLSAVEDKLPTSKSSANTATATNRPVPPADSPEYSEISGIA